MIVDFLWTQVGSVCKELTYISSLLFGASEKMLDAMISAFFALHKVFVCTGNVTRFITLLSNLESTYYVTFQHGK